MPSFFFLRNYTSKYSRVNTVKQFIEKKQKTLKYLKATEQLSRRNATLPTERSK